MNDRTMNARSERPLKEQAAVAMERFMELLTLARPTNPA
jgi:hypothetical protein